MTATTSFPEDNAVDLRHPVQEIKPENRNRKSGSRQPLTSVYKEVVRLVSLRNRVRKQATKLQEDLERGELPD